MKFKAIILSVAWWLLSIFLIFFGIFGSQAVGYFVSIPLLLIGIFINPIFSLLLKKKFFFVTKDSLKLVALLIAVIIFALIKFKVIHIPYNKTTDENGTTTSVSMFIQ